MANSSYATAADVASLWRPLSAAEIERTNALLPLVSDALRQQAINVGKNLDDMIAETPTLASVAKSVTVDVIARVLRQNTQGDAMTQESQSGLGYSWSGTYAIPGGGIENAIMNNDLKRLGLRQQRMGTVQLWEANCTE